MEIDKEITYKNKLFANIIDVLKNEPEATFYIVRIDGKDVFKSNSLVKSLVKFVNNKSSKKTLFNSHGEDMKLTLTPITAEDKDYNEFWATVGL